MQGPGPVDKNDAEKLNACAYTIPPALSQTGEMLQPQSSHLLDILPKKLHQLLWLDRLGEVVIETCTQRRLLILVLAPSCQCDEYDR
jgi:hypothetical protein